MRAAQPAQSSAPTWHGAHALPDHRAISKGIQRVTTLIIYTVNEFAAIGPSGASATFWPMRADTVTLGRAHYVGFGKATLFAPDDPLNPPNPVFDERRSSAPAPVAYAGRWTLQLLKAVPILLAALSALGTRLRCWVSMARRRPPDPSWAGAQSGGLAAQAESPAPPRGARDLHTVASKLPALRCWRAFGRRIGTFREGLSFRAAANWLAGRTK